MTNSLIQSERQSFVHLTKRLKTLGMDSQTAIESVLGRITMRPGVNKAEDILVPGRASRHITVLIAGVACLYERVPNGSRQIFSFRYPGDFCDLNRHVLQETNSGVAVAAITCCSVGTIAHSDLDQLIRQYPELGSVLWRASMLEASILRKRMLSVSRQPALQRVAYLLCEHLYQQEVVGISSDLIPQSQLDLADAAGLSNVHVSRVFKELQRLELMSKEGRVMKVRNRQRLASLAEFDGAYLNMLRLRSEWQVKIDPP
jgi:CRP-like cAMP-binding protein